MAETKPRRVRVRGGQPPAASVLIGRPSKWGNPFAVRETVHRDSPLWPYLAQATPGGGRGFHALTPLDRRVVQDAYGWWLFEQPHLMLAMDDELAGRNLACCCPLPAKGAEEDLCHGAVLLEMANETFSPSP